MHRLLSLFAYMHVGIPILLTHHTYIHSCGISTDGGQLQWSNRRFPVDNAVDIAFIEEDEDGEEGLCLIESDDELMDQLFPIAKELVEQDEAAKLALYRTPATLTLAGNLGIDDDEDEEDEDENEEDEEEAADLLLSFDFEGKEYHLVRPTDLMLLVGKEDATTHNKDGRVLINDEESEAIMPTLMEMLGL